MPGLTVVVYYKDKCQVYEDLYGSKLTPPQDHSLNTMGIKAKQVFELGTPLQNTHIIPVRVKKKGVQWSHLFTESQYPYGVGQSR